MKNGKRFKKEYVYAVLEIIITLFLCTFSIISIELNFGLLVSGICSLLIIINTALILYKYLKTKRIKDSVESLAQTDSLTGISNRRFFMEYAEAQIERTYRLKKECYIIMFDIDNFKLVNDRYGHTVGDDILKNVCKKVKSEIRPYDLFARYGGEEFILLICDAQDDTVVSLAIRLCRGIEGLEYECDGEKIITTASFGVAKYSKEHTLSEVIEFADSALYKAKNSGRNTVNYYSEQLNSANS